MSGWAMSGRCPSTTKACPALPILIWDTTSQMNLRLTSTTMTPPSGPLPPPPASCRARTPCGSRRARSRSAPARASWKRGSFEKSAWLPATSMARREIRSCSRPAASSRLTSVMAGTWRWSRMKSKRRCSSAALRRHELGLGDPADLPLDLPDEALDAWAAACAFSFWMGPAPPCSRGRRSRAR